MAHDKEYLIERKRRDDETRKKMQSFMCNTKWRRLFTGLENSGLSLPVCCFKFICEDRIFKLSTPVRESFDEIGVLDVYSTGPFRFKRIEWILWPARYEVDRGRGANPWVKLQNLDKLTEVITSLGKFEYEANEQYFKIYGYK